MVSDGAGISYQELRSRQMRALCLPQFIVSLPKHPQFLQLRLVGPAHPGQLWFTPTSQWSRHKLLFSLDNASHSHSSHSQNHNSLHCAGPHPLLHLHPEDGGAALGTTQHLSSRIQGLGAEETGKARLSCSIPSHS